MDVDDDAGPSIIEDGEEEEEEEVGELATAADVVRKLEEVWVNEKLSPELLNYEDELVDCLVDQVQHMESSLQKVNRDDFRLVCHKMELDRIKFVLNSYLRTRLSKIEKFCGHLLKLEDSDPALRVQMCEEERKFAKEYVSNMKSYLNEVALKHMPANMQSLPLDEMSSKPQLKRSVFIRAKEECQGVLLEAGDYGEEEIVRLDQGSQHVLQYKSIASLLKRGAVQLI